MADNKKLGFVGLGIMGFRMARNLVKNLGSEIFIYDVSTAAVNSFKAAVPDATVCSSARAVAEKAVCYS